MSGEQKLSIDDVKKILQLYEGLRRLEVINEKIKSNNMGNAKKKIAELKSIRDEKRRNEKLERCLLEMIDSYEENKENIYLYHTTVISIVTALEKIIFSDKAEGDHGDVNTQRSDGRNNGSIQ